MHRYTPAPMPAPLYLPVENQVRELDAKILFACIAASRGLPTVLGFKPYLYFAMPRLAPGIFIAKSMRAGSRLMFDIMRGLGQRLVAWDEESLVRYASPEYYAWRFSAATFAPLEALYAWGHDDAEMFRAYPGNPGIDVRETGNPRVDLLRPELRDYFAPAAQALRDRYGDFVLVNTNFSFVNPFLAAQALVLPADAQGRRRASRTAAGMSDDFALGMAAHQQHIFEAFRALLPRLAARFPGHTIVLRPHPSENHALWTKLLGDHTNVVVAHEGNVIPWLMACRVLLHNGCTTAVEGALLERPAISYRPLRSAVYDYALPNSLSHEADDIDTVLELTAEIVDGRRGTVADAQRSEVLARHLASVDGALASRRIVDHLLALDSRAPAPAPHWSRARARLVATARTALKRVNMQRRHHWASRRYLEHIYPEIALDDVRSRIERLDGLLGGFADLRVERVSRFLFRVAPRAA
ncbi:MAG: hypothetical protein KDK06_05360 [Gammaproteobacteria bacterium]|nr:hypothetical protein [Gammaproteobacteria bacterium]